MHFNEKWQKGLDKTRKGFLGRIVNVFRKPEQHDDSIWESLEQILIEADIGVDTTCHLIQVLQSTVSLRDSNCEEKTISLLKHNLLEILTEESNELTESCHPCIILVVGVNGTGKTTTIGKLAHHFRENGKRVLLAAADTFRAAAGEQLEIWGNRSGADVVRQCMGADPAAVAFDALNATISREMDILIVDTAGRLHTKTNLMEELKKIQRVLGKRMERAPHETFLVIDATTGQNGLQQARLFTKAIHITGVILTKLDGTARGGIVVSIKKDLGLSVKWVGIGEGLEDLIPFKAEAFVDELFGV
jgi:fused signal recognition particle receptor